MKFSLLSLALTFTFLSLSSSLKAQHYKSDNLEVSKLAENVYQHISFLKTQDFGKVSCNGMIVVDGAEALVFDTPADAAASEELISWIESALKSKVKAVVATHFHADCLAGLDVFHAKNIPSYAQALTLKLAAQKQFPIPMHAFDRSLSFTAGRTRVSVEYHGAGHTQDNTIAYVPSAKIMFGGCLVKEQGAGKGNLEDADTAAWPGTVQRIKTRYPNVKLIIPGHGAAGGIKLLEYTRDLFQ
jgi:metallo-beta-lactamase class B